MKNKILKLVRENIQKFKPYQSARRIGGHHGNIWLNANESPISTSFKTKKISFNRYPECQPDDLISAYANYINLPNNQILATRGADEGIELLIKAFCNPGQDAIMYFPPTYDMYGVTAKIAGITIKEIPTIKNIWQLDLVNIKLNLSNVKIIYICNPNNPTGNIILKEDIIYLLDLTSENTLIVVDEAYIEFFPESSMVCFLKKYSNLVILRTLSKAFSLAGIRCGFTLANKNIIDVLNKVISPYPISMPVSDIAVQSLNERYIQLMKNRVVELNNNRIWLIKKLKNISFVEKVFNSNANYILVKFFICNKIFKFLWDNGVIVRNQSDKIHLKRCIRVSIGTKTECRKLISSLNDYLLK